MAYVRPVEGLAVAGMTDSGHMIPMDTKKIVGGLESAATPMELVLQALMGCTMMDVISILKKMKVKYEEFTVSETNVRSEDHPKVYTGIELTFSFKGEGIDEEKVKKAVKLSKENYCSVSAMLSDSFEITYKIVINEITLD